MAHPPEAQQAAAAGVTAAELAALLPDAERHEGHDGPNWTAECPRCADHPANAPREVRIWTMPDGSPRVVCLSCSPGQVLAALGISSAEVATTDPPSLTDMGNAQRLAALHGENLRYDPAHGWRCWNGRYWADDATGEVERMAKDTARTMQRDAAATDDDDERTRRMKAAIAAQSAAKLHAMVDLARSEPGIAMRPDGWNRQPQLLNLTNGTLELATGTFRPHRREDYLTFCAPATYDPTATCPRWEAFLAEVLPDAEVRACVQRASGYSLTGETCEQKVFILHGTGANGKSVFIDVTKDVLGSYATPMDMSSLVASRNQNGPRNDLARLDGIRMTFAIETRAGQGFDEPTLKLITGGDTFVARRLYKESVEIVPTFKIWIAANHRPTVSPDPAVWRRLAIVPFTVTIPPARQDPQLAATLKREASGILNWMLAGLRDWQAGGLRVPSAMQAAVADYRSAEDVLAGFLDECVTFADDTHVLHKDLYAAYVAWAERTGETPISSNALGRSLGDRGVRQDRRGPRGSIRRLGLQLCEQTEPIPGILPRESLTRENTETGAVRSLSLSPDF